MEGSHPGTGTPRALSGRAQRGISCDTPGWTRVPRRTAGLGPKAGQQNIFHPNELCIYAARGERREVLASQWEPHTPLRQAPSTVSPLQPVPQWAHSAYCSTGMSRQKHFSSICAPKWMLGDQTTSKPHSLACGGQALQVVWAWLILS